jgi:hypothetical protein
MESSEFPPNSEASKRAAVEKDIHKVVSGDVVRKKKSLRKRFSESFVAGDAKSATQYVMLDVLLPAAKDAVVDAVSSGFEKLIYGESRRYRGATRPESGPTGVIQYHRMGQPSRLPSSQRAISRQARARHDFDEVVLDSRTEAEQVIDQLFDVVSRYEAASVADLYALVGLASTHTDYKWGWTDLQGAGVTRIRDGFVLDLPDPGPLA